MSSIKLYTYPRSENNNNEAQQEQFFVDFENDFSDVFPTPKELQQLLQKFLDVIWESELEKNKNSCDTLHQQQEKSSLADDEKEQTSKIITSTCRKIEMKNFSLIGGDEESIDIRYSIFDQDTKQQLSSGVCQVPLPDDPLVHYGAAAFENRGGNENRNSTGNNNSSDDNHQRPPPRRMNDGGEYVDDLDYDDYDDGAEYY